MHIAGGQAGAGKELKSFFYPSSPKPVLYMRVQMLRDNIFTSVELPVLLFLFHISDSSMDGVDQYEMIINGGDSARDEFVYNIDMETDPIFGQAAIR